MCGALHLARECTSCGMLFSVVMDAASAITGQLAVLNIDAEHAAATCGTN